MDLPADRVLARARSLRRGRRGGVAAVAVFVAVVGIAMSSVTWLPGRAVGPTGGAGRPGAGAPVTGGGEAPVTHPSVHPSLPPIGRTIGTGVRVGGKDLVLWFTLAQPGSDVTLAAGLLDPATGVIDLSPWMSSPGMPVANDPPTGFVQVSRLDAGDGRVVDYGLFVGPASRLTVDAGGQVIEVRLSRWSERASFVAFWAERDGGLDAPRLTAYDGSGSPIGTADRLTGLSPSQQPGRDHLSASEPAPGSPPASAYLESTASPTPP